MNTSSAVSRQPSEVSPRPWRKIREEEGDCLGLKTKGGGKDAKVDMLRGIILVERCIKQERTFA